MSLMLETLEQLCHLSLEQRLRVLAMTISRRSLANRRELLLEAVGFTKAIQLIRIMLAVQH
jgi:hypothetical protein